MDQELAKKVCRLVAGIIVSDDDLDPKEDAFIDRMLTQFGIPLNERDSIFPIVDKGEAVEAMRALEPDVQKQALDLLLEAACADGKVVDEERDYLRVVGQELGISRFDMDNRIRAKLKASSAPPAT